jgi:hypothetical protein
VYRYAVELNSAIKKNKIKLLAGKWVELELTMLNEISLSQSGKECIFSLICRIYGAEEEREDMKVKGVLLGCEKRKGQHGGGKRKGNRGSEYNQSTLYACMEVS